MKLLCVLCAARVMEEMPQAGAAKHFEEYREFTAAIGRSGHVLGCNRLPPPDSTNTLRIRHGRISTTDGPYAETKEQLGG